MNVGFSPKDESPALQIATREYQKIWEEEGQGMIKVLEKNASRQLKDISINAIVYEGPSHSGNDKSSMKLRASYDKDTKRGTLMHELSHWLLLGEHFDDSFLLHKTIYPFLYKSWKQLYGKGFARRQVEIESARLGKISYKKAWEETLEKIRQK